MTAPENAEHSVDLRVIDVVASPAHRTQRLRDALGRGGKGSAALAPATVTYDELLRAVFASVCPGRRVAPARVERMEAARAVRAAWSGRTFDAMDAVTVGSLGRSLALCARHGLDAAGLRKASEETPAEEVAARGRLARMADAFDLWVGALDERGLVPSCARESMCARALASRDDGGAGLLPRMLRRGGGEESAPVWLRVRGLVLPEPACAGLLLALARALGAEGGRLSVHVLCEPRRERLPANTDRALQTLESDEMAPVDLELALRDPDSEPMREGVRAVVDALGSGGRAEDEALHDNPFDAAERAKCVRAVEAYGPDEEARRVAAWVEALVVERGMSHDEIAVLYRGGDPGAAAPLRRALEDAGVPVREPRDGALVDPAVQRRARAMLALAGLAHRGAPRDELERVLVALGVGASAGQRPTPAKLASALRLIGCERLFDEKLGLEAALRAASARVPEAVQGELARVRGALAPLREAGTVREHCGRLRSALDALCTSTEEAVVAARKSVAAAPVDAGARAVLRAAEQYAAARSLVETVLATLGRYEDEACALRGFLTALDDATESVLATAGRGEGEGRSGGGVLLCDAEYAAGLALRAVAVTGVCDGGYPGHGLRDASLGDVERRSVLRATGVLLPREGSRDAEALWFLASVACATEDLLCTWPRHDAAGRAKAPSPFTADLRRVLGTAPERAPLDPLARDPWAPARGYERAARALAKSAHGGASEGRLARSLRSAQARAEGEAERRAFFAGLVQDPGRYSGRIDHDREVVEGLDLARYGGREKGIAATTLERTARCAFKAFAHYVLKLRAPEEPGLTLDARERGHLLHTLLEAGQKALHEAQSAGPYVAWSRVLAALNEAGEVAMRGSPQADVQLLRADLLAIRRQVEVYLQRRMDAGTRWELIETEVGFGPTQGAWPAVEVPVENAEPIVLIGRIDGIEQLDGEVRVVEFKTGRGDGFRKRLREGALDTQFQLVVYAAAAARAAEQGALPEAHAKAARDGAVDGVYVGFRDDREFGLRDTLGKPARGQPADTALDVSALLRDGARGEGALADAVRNAVLPVRKGVFAARARDCDFCDAGPLCRVERLGASQEE